MKRGVFSQLGGQLGAHLHNKNYTTVEPLLKSSPGLRMTSVLVSRVFIIEKFHCTNI